jgi:DNA polymerase III subunit epsilon
VEVRVRFVAIDVETANANMASICSIGVAIFENNALSNDWYSLVDPEDYFHPVNVSIHGISERTVAGAPTFATVASVLDSLVGDSVGVTHTHFDRLALRQAASRYGIQPLSCRWLDSAQVARRSWAECAKSGYGLAALCRKIDYRFNHHNALEDAKAAGQVLIAAMADTGLRLDEVLERVRQPIDLSTTASVGVARDGNPEGVLYGEVIVFTGALEIPRREAADLAASAGCEVATGINKRTTLLVVGDMDVQRLAGHEKSTKHRKAEELIASGQSIRIIRETDFRELVGAGLKQLPL